MIRSVSARHTAEMTVAANPGSKKSPVFSVNSTPAPSVGRVGAQPVRTTAVSSQITASSPNLRQLFGASSVAPAVTATAPGADPPFTPAFRSATGTDGQFTWNLNSNYFATKETAQWIANKYGTGEVI